MTPYSYGPLIWGKGAKIMQSRKNNLYIKWCWDNGISHANENGPSLSPDPKINSKCIIDLNVRAKTIKLLEENTGINICDLGLGKTFLDITTKA